MVYMIKETGVLAAPVSFMCFSTSCGIYPVFLQPVIATPIKSWYKKQNMFDCKSSGTPHRHCMDVLIAEKP